MKALEDLLERLGVKNYTKRHLEIISDFLKSGELDCKKLLDQLGDWDENDLFITERWFDAYFKSSKSK